MERTLLIIKPDAVKRNLTGYIIWRLNQAGFLIAEMRLERLSRQMAREFYAVHKDKSFYESLVEYMSSGPIVAMALEKNDAIAALREFIGATNPAKAACGTIRQEIALNVQENSVHASDSPENAAKETAFFFG
ncbi:MAG: nucleoside-diphosphate kinase [candidate division Zixibacteria bacterium]|nr:nucleoside-diphosphate kinase [candidate division Zixibacteria bacterium]